MTDSPTKGTNNMSIHSKEYRKAAREVFRAAAHLIALTEKADESYFAQRPTSVEYTPRFGNDSQQGAVVVKRGNADVARVEFNVKDKFSQEVLDEFAQAGIKIRGT